MTFNLSSHPFRLTRLDHQCASQLREDIKCRILLNVSSSTHAMSTIECKVAYYHPTLNTNYLLISKTDRCALQGELRVIIASSVMLKNAISFMYHTCMPHLYSGHIQPPTTTSFGPELQKSNMCAIAPVNSLKWLFQLSLLHAKITLAMKQHCPIHHHEYTIMSRFRI